MNDTTKECNADLDHPCDAGNNGDPCASCQRDFDEVMAWVREEATAAHYVDDMHDAGRGHSLSTEERR